MHARRLIITVFYSIWLSAGAQPDCPVIRDTVVSGNQSGSFAEYLYDAEGKIFQIHYYDPGVEWFSAFAVLSYNKEGQLTRIEDFMGSRTLNRMTQYTYKDGKVARVIWQKFTTPDWYIAYDITYDKYGNIASMMADKVTIRGGEIIFAGSFLDFVWKDGNAVSFKIVIDDVVVSVSATYDDRANFYKKLVNPEGALGVLLAGTKNNVFQWKVNEDGLVKRESLPPGSIGLDRNYTYTADNEVESIVNSPSLLLNAFNEIRYLRDCNAEKASFILLPEMEIKMDKEGNAITLNDGYTFNGYVKVYAVPGWEKRGWNIENAVSLDISEIEPGIYYVDVSDGVKDYRARFAKPSSGN